MGPFLPDQLTLAKGPVTFALDEMSIRPNARELFTTLKHAIDALEPIGYASLETVLEKYLLDPIFRDPSKSAAAASYLNRFWFNQKSPDLYFVEEQPIMETFALGVIQVINLALRSAPSLPIDAWWMIDHARFEVLNLASKHQITMIFASPRPKGTFSGNVMSLTSEAYSTRRSRVETRRLGKSA